MRVRSIVVVVAMALAAVLVLPGGSGAERLDGSEGGGAALHAAMTGAEEVPPGDPDGTGTALITVNAGLREVCWELTVERIAPATAAHIHVGPPGIAGPIVVPLSPPTDGTSEGCTTAERELAVNLVRDTADYYVNVHNAEHPSGAVRGQLSKA